MYTDISLDLETLDTSPRALILSMGFVVFNRYTGEISNGCELHTSITSQLFRRKIDWNTVKWWVSQSKTAKAKVLEGQKKAYSIRVAARSLARHIEALTDPKEVVVWGNGSDFDNAILADVYKNTLRHSDPPWKHWNNACIRTLLREHEHKTGVNLKKSIPFEGLKHSALDDAKHQAKLVIAACK